MSAELLNGYSDMSEVFEIESDEEEVTIKPYEVDCLPNDYNITSLISLIERGYLKIPSFQRNYVWKKDMASKFIESIIIGLPIPQLFLFERERNNFLVIDPLKFFGEKFRDKIYNEINADTNKERQLKAFQEIFAIRNLIAHQTFVEFSSNKIRGKSFADIKQLHEDAIKFVKCLIAKFA